MEKYEPGDSPLVLEMRSNQEFISTFKEAFATRLEERATDPDSAGRGDQELFDMAQKVRDGKKIERRPAALEVMSGVCFDGPLADRYTFTPNDVAYFGKLFFSEND